MSAFFDTTEREERINRFEEALEQLCQEHRVELEASEVLNIRCLEPGEKGVNHFNLHAWWR